MIISRLRRLAAGFALCAAAFLAMTLWPHRAAAQIDPFFGAYLIMQDGRVVGQIYVPQIGSTELRVEHWVLYPGYVYPGASAPTMQTDIFPVQSLRYSSEQDFFARVTWTTGSRYVKVTAHQTVPPTN